MNGVRFQDVSFTYGGGGFALRAVTFEAREGEIWAVLGPNGTGKSTLFRLACALLQPREGTITVAGNDVHTAARGDLARSVAYVAQHAIPPFGMTAREYVLLGRLPYARGLGFATAGDHDACAEALAHTDAERFANKSLATLSSGELQRVFLARALAQRPRVLLLDEPVTHLDPEHQLAFARLVRAWRQRTNGCVMASFHELNLASMIADRCIVMHEGRIAATGTPAEVLTEELIARVFRVQARVVAGAHGASPAIHVVLDEVERT